MATEARQTLDTEVRLDPAEVERTWTEKQIEHNSKAWVPALWVVAVLYPLFGVLDYFVAPREWLWLLYSSRAVVTVVTFLCILWVVKTQFFRRHTAAITGLHMMLVSGGIAVMISVMGGLASSYYAGLILVSLMWGLVFLWPAKYVVFHWISVLMYLAPNLILGNWGHEYLGFPLEGEEALKPYMASGTNFAFLSSTALIVSVGQIFAYRAAYKKHVDELILERTKATLEAAHEELKQLDKLKSQFFANLTHELRTPLTMILSPVEMLLSDGSDDPGQRTRYLRGVWVNALKLLKLINNLLDLAKLGEKFLRLRLERSDLRQLLEELAEHAQGLASRKGIKLELDVASAPKDLRVDLEKIERVFVNLVSNALKFTPEGGKVTVRLETSGDDVRVSVRDTGPGIPQEKLENIFERFTQADAGVTRKFGGTGIGLAFAREIAELHGGRIGVESTVGEGSCFTVHLKQGLGHFDPNLVDTRAEEEPKAEEAADGAQPQEWSRRLLERTDYRYMDLEDGSAKQEEQTAATKATKILVVEDNPAILKFTKTLLEEEYHVFTAVDGVLGLEVARAQRPDLIVTDFMMPNMDGVTMIKEIRGDEATADIPIIMLTAKNNVEDRQEAREKGADVYLNKPFSPRELQTAIGRLLDQRGRQVKTILRAQTHSLEVMSAGLAHEIQGPLANIKNVYSLVSDIIEEACDTLGSEQLEARDKTTRLQEAVARIGRLQGMGEKGIRRIEQLVSLVRRYARSGYQVEVAPMMFDDALRDVLSFVVLDDAPNVKLRLNAGAPGGLVCCVAEEMHQVIRNIVENAVEALGDSGTVEARTRLEGDQLVFEVVDDGPGIADDIRDRVFVPFFTTKESAMGLGLAIARQVVEEAQGEIEISSVPGKGTTVRVRLPRATPQGGDAPASAQPVGTTSA